MNIHPTVIGIILSAFGILLMVIAYFLKSFVNKVDRLGVDISKVLTWEASKNEKMKSMKESIDDHEERLRDAEGKIVSINMKLAGAK